MNYDSLETRLIRQQNQYIRTLEEQLALYKEKDHAQEQLIEELNRTLQIFSDEITRLKSERDIPPEEKDA